MGAQEALLQVGMQTIRAALVALLRGLVAAALLATLLVAALELVVADRAETLLARVAVALGCTVT
jgi:hypothetical protein